MSHAAMGEFVNLMFKVYVYADMGDFPFSLVQSPGYEALRNTPVTTRHGRVSIPVLHGRSNHGEDWLME